MFHMPLLRNDFLCIYGKEKELICAWFDTQGHQPVCKALERYSSDIPWLIDGVLYNTVWALESVTAFVRKHRLSNTNAIIAFDQKFIHESLWTNGMKYDPDNHPSAVEVSGFLSTTLNYVALVPHVSLVQYQLFAYRAQLYALGCVTSAWALLTAGRICVRGEFEQIIQSCNLAEILDIVRCRSSEHPMVQTLCSSSSLNSDDVVVTLGLYYAGRALYEAI